MSGPIRVVAGALLGMLLVLGAHTRMVDARSWDLAVAKDKEIVFFAENGDRIGKSTVFEKAGLVAIAYDDETSTMFLSDAHNRDYSIFSVDIMTNDNVTAKPLLKREKKDLEVRSMVFDGQTRTLFWTTKTSVMKMSVPLKGATGPALILHELDNLSPNGITLDACNRHIYWVNNNHTNQPSIMRSNLDGSNRTVIVSEELYNPVGIAVDHFESKLYWVDDEEGIHFKVEKSNLDGSERQVVVKNKNHQPLYLAVSKKNVYWTDGVARAVWKISKDAKIETSPGYLISYYSDESNPVGIVARDNSDSIDCKRRIVKEEVKRKVGPTSTPTTMPPNLTTQSFNNYNYNNDNNNFTTTSAAEDRGKKELLKCFNGGLLDKTGSHCQCKPGYTGTLCEISACHNYCLRGECFLSNKGMPVCKCVSKNYTGARCESDACKGYCLNGGRCLLDNGKPTCECNSVHTSGPRCEASFDMGEVCALYCMNRQLKVTSIDTSTCRCTELNQTIEEVLSFDKFNCTILVTVLAVFVGMLSIVVIFLTVYVSRLKRRPRIKKRFVVNKAGITPLTSRPSQITGDQCEITIENCCNMNICETPCFEPKLRTTNTKSGKKEEKNGLLDHMEDGGNLC